MKFLESENGLPCSERISRNLFMSYLCNWNYEKKYQLIANRYIQNSEESKSISINVWHFLIFKIYLPSGTYIQTRLWLYKNVNVMEVDIFPSRADIHKSEGLCSKLGSNKLIKRDGRAAPFSAQPDDFSLSWR